MKVGIITDVHSNIIALNAVLNEFEKIEVDKIICCGDIIGIGPNPEETVQELIKNKDKLIAVRGNHEQYLLKGLPKNVHDDKRTMSLEEIDNHEWTHSKLSENSKNFIRQFKISNIIEIEGNKIYIVHYPSNEKGIYIKHIRKPTIKQNEEMFSGIDADILIYGHTHTTSINNKNNKWYINSGSLGCPVKSNIANAGILEINKNEIHYEQLKIEYNVNEVIQEIERLKFPFYKGILKIFYGKE
jgi:putative phosphoesterase